MSLPNLDIRQQVVDGEGYPTLPFHVWWKRFADELSSTNASLQEQLNTITGIDSDLSSILTTAENSVVVNSGTINAALTGSDVGTDARISVSSHSRVYGDATLVAVNAGTINGLAFSTTYYVYYDQASRAGGSVQYQATTSKTTAIPTATRHFVGTITTPADAAANTTGVTVDPPGFANLPGSGGGGGGTVTSVGGTGTVSGITLSGTVTTAGNLTLGGSLSTTSAAISDFNSATRAQTEAELIAGANVTITPASSGATRTLTIAASGGVGTVTSVSGAGAVSGLTLTGTVTGAGSITLGGSISIPSTSISDFNSATRAQTEAELIAGSNITITPGSSGATRTLTIAASGGGSPVSGIATVTVPNSRMEWEETVTTTGAAALSKIYVTLHPGLNRDENTADMLPPMTVAGTPVSFGDSTTFILSFSEPVSGPIKLNWSAL